MALATLGGAVAWPSLHQVGGIGSLTFHMQGSRASLVAQLHEILALWDYQMTAAGATRTLHISDSRGPSAAILQGCRGHL
jgi:hypothetical protein